MIYQFSKELYSKEVLFKAAYRFIDNFYLHIDVENEKYVINIVPKSNEFELTENEFVNEILIQQAREIIENRTCKIRELMYARALASTVIEENNSVEAVEDDDSADEILIDWFDKYE